MRAAMVRDRAGSPTGSSRRSRGTAAAATWPRSCGHHLRHAAAVSGIHWAAGGGAVASTALSTIAVALAVRLQWRQQWLDESAQARKVSAWLELDSELGAMRPVIVNGSDTALYRVNVIIRAVNHNHVTGEKHRDYVAMGLQVIQPGETSRNGGGAGIGEKHSDEERVFELDLAFRDSSGSHWLRENDASLTLVFRQRDRWLRRTWRRVRLRKLRLLKEAPFAQHDFRWPNQLT